MNETESKKQHEMWFKDEYPEEYLLFIHDASMEALVKFVNSEKSWQASANRDGYKLAPVEATDAQWEAAIDAYTIAMDGQDVLPASAFFDIYEAMIGAAQELNND